MAKYFVSSHRGEIQSLREKLNSSHDSTRTEAVKRIVAAMTEGKDPFQMPAAALAYLGDAVYEIEVRTTLVLAGAQKPSVASLQYVTASAQCRVLEKSTRYVSGSAAPMKRSFMPALY